MPSSSGLDTATLVSIFVESVLYGLFIVLFVISTSILWMRRRRLSTGINKPMLAVSIVMFLLATTHVAADLQRLLIAFLHNIDTPTGPSDYLSRVNSPMYSFKSAVYVLQTLVGDGFLIYRLHLVWKGDKRVVIPFVFCLTASAGVGIGTLYNFSRVSPNAPVFISRLGHWIVSFFSITLFTNFSCSTLIAARIWWMYRKTMNAIKGRSLVPAAVVVIESGAIYSACLIILLALYVSGSYAQYIFLDSVTQVIGVVFSLVIVRVGLGLSSDAASDNPTRLTLFSSVSDDTRPRSNRKPITMTITRVTHTDTEPSYNSKPAQDFEMQDSSDYTV